MTTQIDRINLRGEAQQVYRKVVDAAWEEYTKREQQAWETFSKTIDKIQNMALEG